MSARLKESDTHVRRVHAAVDHIRHAHGLVTMDSLAAHVELTSRHLERHFKNAVGISPKRLARITRFQRALRMFEQLDSPQRGTHTAAQWVLLVSSD